jgi:predicted dehydrogenase
VAGLAWREVGTRRTFLGRNPRDPGMVATRTILEGTLQAFRDGTEPPVPARVARDVIAVLAACYRAAATGCRITLDPAGERDLADFRMGATEG